MTILSRANLVRPVDARLFARENGMALSSRQLAKRSGLAVKTINKLSRLKSWDAVQVGMADRFLEACGVTDRNRWRVKHWIARSVRCKKGFKHVRKLIGSAPATRNGHTPMFYVELLRTCLS